MKAAPLLALPVMFVTLARAEPTPQEFHALVVTTYNFSPQKLTSEEIDKKSAVLDKFWDKVKADPQEYLALLRTELGRGDAPAFFEYDGAMLLLSLSQAPGDKALALASITRADLKDLVRDNYFYEVRKLALAGLDVTDAALKILDDDTFQIFVPQHALTLGQNYSLIYLLTHTDEARYVPKLIARFAKEGSPIGRKSLLYALWYSATTDGVAFVRQIAESKIADTDSKKLAGEFIARLDNKSVAAEVMGFSFSSLQALRQKRRDTMRNVSDEALIDFEKETFQILRKLD